MKGGFDPWAERTAGRETEGIGWQGMMGVGVLQHQGSWNVASQVLDVLLLEPKRGLKCKVCCKRIGRENIRQIHIGKSRVDRILVWGRV